MGGKRCGTQRPARYSSFSHRESGILPVVISWSRSSVRHFDRIRGLLMTISLPGDWYRVITLIARLVVVVGCVVIVQLTFSRLRERALAVRGLLSLGFLGLFLSVCSWFPGQRPDALLLGVSCLPFAIVLAIKTWGTP